MAAIETEFQFLKAEAIPDDTGFAVIEDEGGKVLFHSDDNRSLWENFFEETDDNAQLKAHVFSRTAGKAEGNYWGKGHSFYSVPLPAVPWSLVVFRNKELFRTTNFEALLLASVFFLLYTAIPIMVSGAIWLFNKARRRKMFLSWFWPDPDRYDCYSIYIGLNFFFFLAGITWFWFSNPLDDHAVWVALLHLLFSLTLFLIVLFVLWGSPKVSPKRRQGIFPEQLHRRYACMIVSFLLLFSALPMGIFFKIGVDREMTLAMKYNLITLGHKLRQTPELDFSQIQRQIREIDTLTPIAECSENECESVKCDKANSQQEGCPLECSEKYVSRNNRTLSTHSIHLSLIANTRMYVSDNDPTNSCSHTKFSLLEKIHKFIRKHSLSRLSNPVSISTLGLLDDQSPGNPFHWRYDSPTSIALDFQASLKPSDFQTKWAILRSWPPANIWWSISDFPAKRHVLSLSAFIAGALVLVVVPIFIVSRIFPIFRESSTKENSNQKQTKRDSNPKEANLLIIGLPSLLDTSCTKKDNIDCRQISKLLKWWMIKMSALCTKKTEVVLDHFEYQFGVPQFDRAKLELLAALLVKSKQICVRSTINPLLDRKDDPESSSPARSKRPVPVSLQEWSQVFQTFTLRYSKQDEPETALDSRSVPANEPYYEAIWQARTMDEKITLHHLAQDGFVHAENPDLPHLFDLGLIKFNPDPRWLEDDFEKYVLNAAQRDGLDASEREKRQSRWDVWKWPLAVVLIVLGMGLLLTQQEFKNVVVLMLSILPVLPSTLSELFGSMGKADKSS